MAENSKPTNIERLSDLIDLEVQDGEEVQIEEPMQMGEGDIADVESATATVRLPVKLLSELMPGTVALPHGWGHQHAIGLSVAGRTSGVNVNLLAADGPESLERVSGMAQLTGIPVSVRPAAGPRDCRSWSGISDPTEPESADPSR